MGRELEIPLLEQPLAATQVLPYPVSLGDAPGALLAATAVTRLGPDENGNDSSAPPTPPSPSSLPVSHHERQDLPVQTKSTAHVASKADDAFLDAPSAGQSLAKCLFKLQRSNMELLETLFAQPGPVSGGRRSFSDDISKIL